MKLRTLIIDDEPLAHDIILTYAEDIPFLEVVGQCYLATEGLRFLSENSVDLIFLDIQMPRLKGLDFLRTLNHQPLVIITSAHEEYALESYELNVCDYLLKPFRFERFLKAINKALELFKLTKQAVPQPRIPASAPKSEVEAKHFFIKSDKKLIQLNLEDIYYLESFGNYVKVWLKDQFYLTIRTLSSFEAQLAEQEFLRIHKSYIIQKTYINYLEGNMVVMKNNKKLPLGKNHREAFKKFIST